MLEMALVVAFLFTFILTGLDLLRLAYIVGTTQFVLTDTARWTASATLPSSAADALTAVRTRLDSTGRTMGVNLSAGTLSICVANDQTCTIRPQTGDLFALRFTVPFTSLILRRLPIGPTYTAVEQRE